MKTEVMTVTPKLAEQWLQKNESNRKINPKRVKVYADEMKQGRWVLHHQGIAFYDDGTFADGQHRLAAVVASGCAVDMSVTTGLSKASGVMIDSHQARSAYQSIQMSGHDWIGKDEVAILNNIYSMFSGRSQIKLSNLKLIDMAFSYKSSLLFCKKLKTNPKRHINPSSVMTGIASAYSQESAENLQKFYDVLYSGMALCKEDSSVILLREFLLNDGSVIGSYESRVNVIRKTQRAIMAFCQRQPISKLYTPQDWLYAPKEDKDLPAHKVIG